MSPIPASTVNDDDLFGAFAPLSTDEPNPSELAALRHRMTRGRRPKLSARMVIAVASTSAMIGIALALLPPGGQDVDGQRKVNVFRAAAAIAADQPVPTVAEAPLRYVKVRHETLQVIEQDGRRFENHHAQIIETWVGAKWTGRSVAARARAWNTGDQELAQRILPNGGWTEAVDGPSDKAYAYGDGLLAKLDPTDLPDDRAGIARTLRAGIADGRWSPYVTAGNVDLSRGSFFTYSTIGLLVRARLTPPQRAALLDLLATAPEAKDLGMVKDQEGRDGHGVELQQTLPGGPIVTVFRIIFDPDSSEILQWSMKSPGPHADSGFISSTTTVLSTGFATRSGQRP